MSVDDRPRTSVEVCLVSIIPSSILIDSIAIFSMSESGRTAPVRHNTLHDSGLRKRVLL